MSTIWQVVQDPSPQNITYLVRYLMMFFGGDNAELWRILNRIFHSEIDLRHDEPGRWWTSDVCQTSWRLYVRYCEPPGDQWTGKWRYERKWHEWLHAKG